MELKGKRVLVVGLGLSGAAAARFCAGRGAVVSVTDSGSADRLTESLGKLAGLSYRAFLGSHPVGVFTESDLVVLSPGVPADIEPLRAARESGVPVIAEVELAARFLDDWLVAVTGSNGKSTTTALTAHLLAGAGLDAQACGNIGRPLIELVPGSSPRRRLVVELSSFQLETIDSFHPRVATVLNVTPDHMDRYPSLEAYKQAKMRVFTNQAPTDHAVIDMDEPHRAEFAAATKGKITGFSRLRELDEGLCLRGGSIVLRRGGREIEIAAAADLPIRGPHNLANAMAAVAMAILSGADPRKLAAGLETFRPLEHRLEPVAEIGGVTYINDSKATNVDSAAVALQSFDSPVVLIMGGRDKAGDFTGLRPLVEKHVRMLLLVGEAGPKIGEALAGAAPQRLCRSMEEAVIAAAEAAGPGDTVLLAPGCASFDMYRNFEHRGRHFKELVGRLRHAND